MSKMFVLVSLDAYDYENMKHGPIKSSFFKPFVLYSIETANYGK